MPSQLNITRLLPALLAVCASLAAQAAEIVRVGFPESIPPWVRVDNRPGIAVELLTEALRSEGVTVEPAFFPFSRRVSAYRLGELDALYDVSPALQHQHLLYGYTSRALHSFNNVVIALQKRQLKLDRLQDMQPLRVIAWGGAQADIPGGYDVEQAKAAGKYSELDNQTTQLQALFLGRCDAILADRLIFEWNRHQLGGQQPAVSMYPLLASKAATVLWQDPTMRQRFENGLRRIKQDGRYDAIYHRYQSEPQP